MKIGLRYGHSINCRGAEKLISEVDSCRILYSKVKALLEAQGHIIVDCNSNANTERAELAEGTSKANNANCDVYITIHMNATPCDGGVECWVYDTKSKTAISIGSKICKNISSLGIPNRGIKYDSSYHDLSATSMESIIVETLFCDNAKDVGLFKRNSDGIARAIASGIDSKITLNVEDKPNVDNKEEEEMVKCIIQYENEVDMGAANILADALRCCTINSKRPYAEYNKFEIVIAVGGGSKFSGYTKYKISPSDRYETTKVCSELGARIYNGEDIVKVLEAYKIK